MSKQKISNLKNKGKCIIATFYDDDPLLDMALKSIDMIAESNNFTYFVVCHDSCKVLQCDVDKAIANGTDTKDLPIIGTPKKRHYHVLMCFDCQRYPDAIAKLCFGFPSDYFHLFQKLQKTRKYYLQYMVHQDHESAEFGKHRYDWDDISTNDEQTLYNVMNGCDPLTDKVTYRELVAIYNHIEVDCKRVRVTCNKITKWAFDHGFYSAIYMKMGTIKTWIDDHNTYVDWYVKNGGR